MPSDFRIVETLIFSALSEGAFGFFDLRPYIINPDVKVLWLVLSPNAQNGNLTTLRTMIFTGSRHHMSIATFQRRQLCYQLGTPADKRQFVVFSKNTAGQAGRKVFIDSALAPLFSQFVNTQDAKSIQAILKIEQLRAIAGGVTANTNVATPFEHMETFGDLALYYQVHNPAQGNNAEAGVYITDVKLAANEGNSTAGLYVSKSTRSRVSLDIIDNNIAETNTGVIASAQTSNDAAQKASKLVGPDAWGSPKDFNMFYIPAVIHNEMGLWMTPDVRALRPSKVAKHFADVITATQQQRTNQTPIEWTIEGDSVKILQLALEHLPSTLNKHAFKLIDPVADTVQIVNSLERKGAKLGKDAVSFTGNKRALAAASVSSKRSQISRHQDSAAKALQKASATARDSLANYSASSVKVTSDFMTYVRNLAGGVAW
jgi:hypothetical protein